MHKLTRPFMHFYITLASTAAFALGWAFLAHSPKPAPLVPSQPQPQSQVQASTFVQPTLEPVPSLNDFLKSGNVSSSMPVFQSPSFSFPRLRTRGS